VQLGEDLIWCVDLPLLLAGWAVEETLQGRGMGGGGGFQRAQGGQRRRRRPTHWHAVDWPEAARRRRGASRTPYHRIVRGRGGAHGRRTAGGTRACVWGRLEHGTTVWVGNQRGEGGGGAGAGQRAPSMGLSAGLGLVSGERRPTAREREIESAAKKGE
jgi:hypothetical protein